jgi:hypothetical protein
LRLIDTSKPLDAALAQLGRLVPQIKLDAIPNRRANVCRTPAKLLRCAGREYDLEPHSGQILARLAALTQETSRSGLAVPAP